MGSHNTLTGSDLHAPSNVVVVNESGSDINALKVVKYNGVNASDIPKIIPFASLSDTAAGILDTAITDNSEGILVGIGFIFNLNTTAFALNDILFSDANGDLTTTITDQKIGQVLKVDATEGIIYVNPIQATSDMGSVTTHSDVSDAGSGAIITTGERDKINFLTVTQAVNLDQLEIDVAANTAKVSADGSVTTHNDVTDAGSGAIITSLERSGLHTQNTDTSLDFGGANQVTAAEIRTHLDAISGFTEGSVIFIDSSGDFAENNGDFAWNNSTSRLLIDGSIRVSGEDVTTTTDTLDLNFLVIGNDNESVKSATSNGTAGISASSDSASLIIRAANLDTIDYQLESFGGVLKGGFIYNDSADITALVSTTNLEIESSFDNVDIIAATSILLDSDNGDITIDSSDDILNVLTGTNLLSITRTGGSNASSIFQLNQNGTNPASIDIFAGSQLPNTNVPGDPGDIYFFKSGTSSTLFMHVGAGASSTDWLDLFTSGGGNVTTSDTLTAPFLVFGNGLEDLVTATPDGTAGIFIDNDSSELIIRAATADIIGFELQDDTGTDKLSFKYDDGSDLALIAVGGATTLDISAGNNISLDSSNDILLNVFVQVLDSGETLQIESPDSLSDVSFDLRSSTFVTVLEMEYNEPSDLVIFRLARDYTTLLDDSLFTLSRSGGTSADPVLEIENTGTNGADFQEFVSSITPIGNIVGNPGDKCTFVSGSSSVEFIHKGSVSNLTDWVSNVVTNETLDNSFFLRGNDGVNIGIAGDGTAGIFTNSTNSKISIRPTVGDPVSFELQDSSGGTKFDIFYSDLGDVTSMLSAAPLTIDSTTASVDIGANTSILIAAGTTVDILTADVMTFTTSSATGFFDFVRTTGLDTDPIMVIQHDGTNSGLFEFKVGDRDPLANSLTSTAATIWVVDNGIETDIFLNVSAAGTTADQISLRQNSFLMFGNRAVPSNATTRFLNPWYSPNNAGSTLNQVPLRRGRIRNMRVFNNDVGSGNTETLTVTLRLNEISTTLTATHAANVDNASDLVNVVEVEDGDLADIQIVKSGSTGDLTGRYYVTMEYN